MAKAAWLLSAMTPATQKGSICFFSPVNYFCALPPQMDACSPLTSAPSLFIDSDLQYVNAARTLIRPSPTHKHCLAVPIRWRDKDTKNSNKVRALYTPAVPSTLSPCGTIMLRLVWCYKPLHSTILNLYWLHYSAV